MTRADIAAGATGIALAIAACYGTVQITTAINRRMAYTGCIAENGSASVAHCVRIASR